VQLAKAGARVSGIDSSEAMIAAARARSAEHHVDVAFEKGLAHALPYEAGSFDVVVAVTILCFVEDAAPVFREIARVLQPDGRLVIGELGKWSTWAAGRRVRGWLGSPLWKQSYFRTPGDLRRLALNVDLQPIAVEGAIYFPRSTLAARWMGPLDRKLSRITNFGAAFLVLEARKP
jgi:SAM-dependent methyltransferase